MWRRFGCVLPVVGRKVVPVVCAREFSARMTSRSFATVTKVTYPPPTVFVGKPAPEFTAGAVIDGQISSLSLSSYRGQYVLLLFYPKDFTYVCPTEIIAFNDAASKFASLGAQVIAISTDTEETHLAWIKTPRKVGGLGHMEIPMVADVTKVISSQYGVLKSEAGIALRGLFLIDPQGILQQITINNFPVGRSVDEALRLVSAFQFVAAHGEVCPANWTPGAATMKAGPEDSLTYFNSTYKTEEKSEGTSKLVPVTTQSHLQQLIKDHHKVVVYFMAPWCGKCKMIAPYLEQLSLDFPEILFAKFDTTEPALVEPGADLGASHLPAFHFYENGVKFPETIVGYKKQELRAVVEKLSSQRRSFSG